MRARLSHLQRAGLAIAVAGGMFVTATPAAAATVPADVDIRVIGGNSNAAIVCGNVAAAIDLGRDLGVTVQRSKCTAAATGGNVTLEDVDIIVSSSALALNRDNPVLALLAAGRPPGVAQDKCEAHRPDPGPGVQLNKCWVLTKGGKVKLNNVALMTHHRDGSVTTRTVSEAAVPSGDGGAASARCVNVVNHRLNQRDDCTGTAGGGSWQMRGVDVVIHNPDGTTSTRRGITVEVRGGTATASIYCFNVTDGSGHVVQINVCNADGLGGNATLRNVNFHVSA